MSKARSHTSTPGQDSLSSASSKRSRSSAGSRSTASKVSSRPGKSRATSRESSKIFGSRKMKAPRSKAGTKTGSSITPTPRIPHTPAATPITPVSPGTTLFTKQSISGPYQPVIGPQVCQKLEKLVKERDQLNDKFNSLETEASRLKNTYYKSLEKYFAARKVLMGVMKKKKKSKGKRRRKRDDSNSSFSKDPYGKKSSKSASKAGSKKDGSTASSRKRKAEGSSSSSIASKARRSSKAGSKAGSLKTPNRTPSTVTPGGPPPEASAGSTASSRSRKKKRKKKKKPKGSDAPSDVANLNGDAGAGTDVGSLYSDGAAEAQELQSGVGSKTPSATGSRRSAGLRSSRIGASIPGSTVSPSNSADQPGSVASRSRQQSHKSNAPTSTRTPGGSITGSRRQSSAGSDDAVDEESDSVGSIATTEDGEEKDEVVAGLLALGQDAADNAEAAAGQVDAAMEKIHSILGDKIDNLSDADSDVMEGALNIIDDEQDLDAEGRAKAVAAYKALMAAMKDIKNNLSALNKCQEKLKKLRGMILNKTTDIEGLNDKAEDLRIAIAFNKTSMDQIPKQLVKDPRAWTSDDVGTWVKNLRRKYRQYAKSFVEHNIDGPALWDMTGEILEGTLGIADEKHRQGILRKVDFLQDPKLLQVLRPPTPEGSIRPSTVMGTEIDSISDTQSGSGSEEDEGTIHTDGS